MMSRVKDLAQVVNEHSSFFDGFISTDTGEFGEYLETMLEFHQPSKSFEINNGNSLSSDHFSPGYEILVKGNDKVPIEAVDLELPSDSQARKFKRDIGFVPMSTFRLHCSGATAIRELAAIAKTLKEQRHNLAVLSTNGTTAYVALSEFYA